jgi:oxygen-independent coproporphyrinogen-3 oxidase
MGLRLREGIEPAALGARFNLQEHELIDAARFAFYAKQGLCWRLGERIGVTEAGMPLLDGLLAEVVPAELVGA